MKRLLLLVGLSIFLNNTAFAQIPNAGFESLNPDSTMQYWFNNLAISIGLNDSIITDGPMQGYTTQSYSGNYALELRNSYNVTQSSPYQGNVTSYSDSSIAGFSQWFSITNKPTALNFYYHFVQNPFNDTTYCRVRILNSSFDEIGLGETYLYTATNSYQSMGIPVSYYSGLTDSVPAYASIQFKNIPSPGPHVGQRIRFDELSFNTSPLTLSNQDKNLPLSIAPNPVEGTLWISGIVHSTAYTITDVQGKVVANGNVNAQGISVGHLPSGVYQVQCGNQVGRFIRK